MDLIAFNMSSTKKKYEDPLRIKFVAKSLQLPEVVVADCVFAEKVLLETLVRDSYALRTLTLASSALEMDIA